MFAFQTLCCVPAGGPLTWSLSPHHVPAVFLATTTAAVATWTLCVTYAAPVLMGGSRQPPALPH